MNRMTHIRVEGRSSSATHFCTEPTKHNAATKATVRATNSIQRLFHAFAGLPIGISLEVYRDSHHFRELRSRAAPLQLCSPCGRRPRRLRNSQEPERPRRKRASRFPLPSFPTGQCARVHTDLVCGFLL